MFGGEIPRVPGAATKNTCLTVYIVLLGFCYWIFKSVSLTEMSFFPTEASSSMKIFDRAAGNDCLHHVQNNGAATQIRLGDAPEAQRSPFVHRRCRPACCTRHCLQRERHRTRTAGFGPSSPDAWQPHGADTCTACRCRRWAAPRRRKTNTP